MDNESDTQDPGHTHAGLMYVVCAKCKAWYDVKPGRVNLISHGLCPTCFAEASKELDAMEQEADTRATSATSNQ